ncbi:unnamed protein product [Didymodactylos carnosus]|uniref:PiggyBac transposable element-derived protein domain-containing protein n=1 Tax=Didymodactylos carnosus TaxID=1234261 RepID=A0A8S2IV74_9BILA|nr:unnamed protein product [Didymodactylos carnosus]CAF3760943.1 unnamed protein product [Didymodactylos carnosus]
MGSVDFENSNKKKTYLLMNKWLAIKEQVPLSQYTPNKTTKRGFKFWVRCGISGFVYKLVLYCGGAKSISHPAVLPKASSSISTRSTTKATTNNNQIKKRCDDTKLYGLSGMVVLDLMDRVKKGTHVFVNNYFASVPLIQKMTQLQYGITCTLRSNRVKNCPIESDKYFKIQPRGYYDYQVTADRQCVIVAWKDAKRVLLGSNFVSIDPMVSLLRWDKKTKKKFLLWHQKLLMFTIGIWEV